MKNRRNRSLIAVGVTSLVVAAIGSAYLIGRARAAGVPATQPLIFSGTLTDTAGTPLTGSKNIQVQIWDKATAGNIVCTTGSSAQVLVGGAFSVALPVACVAAVHANPDLWTEVLVDGASVGLTKIGAVPYALEADTASSAAGALDTRIKALEAKKQGHVAGLWSYMSDPATTACASIVNSDWADVPNTSVAISDVGAMMVWATYSINVQPGGASGSEYLGTRLVVDGTPQPASSTHLQPFSTADFNTNLSGNWVGPLAAGAHTVKLQWKTYGTTVTWNNCPNNSWGDGFIGGRTIVVQGYYPN